MSERPSALSTKLPECSPSDLNVFKRNTKHKKMFHVYAKKKENGREEFEELNFEAVPER